MKIRKLIIKNFRGIRNLEWVPDDDGLICLIGHGDSTKSTIITAIEYALYPKSNLYITDIDFYQCKPVENPIEIEIVIGDLSSPKLKRDGTLSQRKSYWSATEKVLKTASEHATCESVLRISLQIDDSLQPFWYVKNEGGEDLLKYGKRDVFNVTRLDGNSERNFKWGYNTILSKLMRKNEGANDRYELSKILGSVGRQARENFEKSSLSPEFERCTEIISEETRRWGAGHSPLSPHLDVFSADSLCLNDEFNVPVYMLGSGSKKLMLIAMAQYLISREDLEDYTILIDEIETGLDPHRLIHVLFALREIASTSNSQIIISTHSPITLKEIAGDGTYRVKNADGDITIRRLNNADNGTIRTQPEMFFLKKVVVCEGKTEIGILRSLKKKWLSTTGLPPEHFGAYFALGEGSSMPRLSKVFKDNDYAVCVYRDNDVTVPIEAGIDDFAYTGTINTEQAICLDASRGLLDSILEYCAAHQKAEIREVPPIPNEINQTYRMELAEFLHEKEVFRRIDTAEILGNMLYQHWSDMAEGDFKTTIEQVKTWIYS